MQQQGMYEHLDEQYLFQHHLNKIVQLNLYKNLIIQLEEYSNYLKKHFVFLSNLTFLNKIFTLTSSRSYVLDISSRDC